MAKFITRIELHGAGHNEPIYEKLHSEMEKAGFHRTIIGDDALKYHLLTAEYYAEGNFTIKEVLDAASEAASTTNKPYGVFVSEFTRAHWIGLKEV